MTSEAPAMPIRALLPYHGGKRALASRLLDAMAPQRSRVRQFVEPFHGSLAMTLALRDEGYRGPVVANDLHKLTHALVVAMACPACSKWIEDNARVVLCHEEAMRRSADAVGAAIWRVDKLLERHFEDGADLGLAKLALHYLVFSWLNRSDQAGLARDWSRETGSFAVRWTATGGDPSKRWLSAVASIPAWHEHLRTCAFTCRDAVSVIESVADEPGAVVYCDPPYLRDTRGATAYAVEASDATGGLMENEDDHARLAASLGRFEKATVGVSYYAHERLARLYPESEGWRCVPMTVNKNSAQARRGAGGVESPEVLIVRNALGGGS